MTAAVAYSAAVPVVPAPADYGQSSTLALPLAEFGRSLADADLDDWFESFAERNSDSVYTYAISHQGKLLIMPLAGFPSVLHEGKISAALYIWSDEHGGIALPATARFVLPDGSRLGPGAAWINPKEQRKLLLPDQRPFPHLVPDFIAEVQSSSISRRELVDKINRFLRYGTQLAWLLDPAARAVIIFRPGREPETLCDPEFVDGDAAVLPGFRFAVREKIFDYFTTAQE